MEALKTVITGVFLAGGCFFVFVSALGIVRFPDFFSRMHPAGKSDTLGHALILIGLMVHEGVNFISVKLLLIMIFILIVNPTATHALAKAAYISGMKPWEKGDKRR